MNPYVFIILVGVLLVITLILIILDKLLGGSTESTITINNDTNLSCSGDETLLNALSDNKIYVPSACGGKATCGLCKVRLFEGGGQVRSTEESFLTPDEKKK